MTPIKRSVLAFSRGPFRPHGDIEYWVDGPLLHYVAHGPFNREAFEALAEASKRMHEQMPIRHRFAHLTEFCGSAMASPEAMATFTAFLRHVRGLGYNGDAVALVMAPEVEGQHFMRDQFAAAYLELGLPCQWFDDAASAGAWLATMLQRAELSEG